MSESRDTQAVGSDPSCKWYVSMLSCASRRSCPSSRNLRIESAHGRPARLSGERFQVNIGHDGVLKLVLLSKYFQSLVSLGWSYHIYNIYIYHYISSLDKMLWSGNPGGVQIRTHTVATLTTAMIVAAVPSQAWCGLEPRYIALRSWYMSHEHPIHQLGSFQHHLKTSQKRPKVDPYGPMCQDDVGLTTINHHLWGQQLFQFRLRRCRGCRVSLRNAGMLVAD